MYGVPATLSLHLDQFIGAALNEIGLGAFIIQFRFHSGEAVIGVEGAWELLGPDGTILDRDAEPATREVYRVHLLLGKTVISHEVKPPESFTLLFDSGHKLRVYDSSSQYESFSIQPGDVFI